MKKTTIGVYDTLEEAQEALALLEKNLIPKNQLTILESHENLQQVIRYQFSGTLSWIGLIVCIFIGVILGILSGENQIWLPIMHHLRGGGWLLGAIAGANMGLIAGGIITFIVTYSLSKVRFANFKAHLLKGRYLLVVKGNRIEAKLAEEIIDEHGKHYSVDRI